MDTLAGMTVLITGSSSGIGAALARELALHGCRLVLLARRRERLDALVLEIENRGGRALAVTADVSHDGDVERAVEQAVATFGGVDVAIANAGFGVVGAFEDLALDDYRRQFETNVFGVLRTAYACLDELSRARGRLVLIGSVAGYMAVPGVSAYSMSKSAVLALATTLRYELAGRGISVTHIAPGIIETEIRRVDNQGQLQLDVDDPVPRWLRVPAPTAARAIVRAIARRKAECVISTHGKAAVWMQRHLPGLVATGIRLGRARGRPEPGKA